jgi:hypothetical protein
MNTRPLARIMGNAGMYFVTPYTGSALAGAPSLDIAAFTALVGLILSASRELIEYGKQREL